MLTTIITYILTTLTGTLIGFLIKSLTKKTKKEKAEHDAVVALLRHEIVKAFEEHKSTKTIPILLKESIMIIYAIYKSLGGNGFIKQLVDEISTWKVVD